MKPCSISHLIQSLHSVFESSAEGNHLEFSAAQQLPNGVYLYVLTIQRGGKVYISNVRKIAILR